MLRAVIVATSFLKRYITFNASRSISLSPNWLQKIGARSIALEYNSNTTVPSHAWRAPICGTQCEKTLPVLETTSQWYQHDEGGKCATYWAHSPEHNTRQNVN